MPPGIIAIVFEAVVVRLNGRIDARSWPPCCEIGGSSGMALSIDDVPGAVTTVQHTLGVDEIIQHVYYDEGFFRHRGPLGL